MYQNYLVNVPGDSNKVTRRIIKGTTYIYYEISRTYVPEKQYTNVTRKTIGKQSPDDISLMYPNQNYLTLFPCETSQEIPTEYDRSNCMKVGTNLIIDKILKDSKLTEILYSCFNKENLGLLLDDSSAIRSICITSSLQFYLLNYFLLGMTPDYYPSKS